MEIEMAKAARQEELLKKSSVRTNLEVGTLYFTLEEIALLPKLLCTGLIVNEKKLKNIP